LSTSYKAAVTLASVVPIGPPCRRCAGGGELNGVVCPDCGGSTRAGRPERRRWRWPSPLRVADALARPAGTLVRWSMSLPGVAGAGAVSYGLAAVVHGLAPRVPELAAGLLVAGVFALALDRRL
jgi:hypothetical protein